MFMLLRLLEEGSLSKAQVRAVLCVVVLGTCTAVFLWMYMQVFSHDLAPHSLRPGRGSSMFKLFAPMGCLVLTTMMVLWLLKEGSLSKEESGWVLWVVFILYVCMVPSFCLLLLL
jgi:hypothetical protein